MQPYLAMGSLQWSQCLSPSFPFALRRWSPCPRHLLSLTPGKSWMGFRFTSCTVYDTRPPREGHDACPLLGFTLQIRPLLFLGPSGLYSGSLGAGRSRGPAMPSRNQQFPGRGVGVPTSLPVFPTPKPSSTHTYPSSGLRVSAAPLHLIRSDSPPPLAQPEGGLCRRRRHVPKETAGSQ